MLQIKINSNGTSKYIGGAIFPKGALSIEFLDFPKITNGEFRFISMLKTVEGDIKHLEDCSVTADSPRISINEENLCAGVFKSKLIYILNGREVRRYVIEDLTVTQVDGSYENTPRLDLLEKICTQIQNDLRKAQEAYSLLEKNISDKEEKFNSTIFNLTDKLNAVENQIAVMKENIAALIKFAFKDWKENIYLDGNDNYANFLKEFGFKIAGVNDNKEETKK